MQIRFTLLPIFFFLIGLNISFSQEGNSVPTIKDQFPKKSGHLRMNSFILDYGRIKSNVIKNDTIRFYNEGKVPMIISVPAKLPLHLRVNIKGSPVKAGGQGLIIVTYEAFKKSDFGFVMDRIQLSTDDTISPQKFISVTATIEEYFTQSVMADTVNYSMRIPEQSFYYGSIKQGDRVSHDFKIYNNGRRPLSIRKIKTDNLNLKAVYLKKDILSGDSTIIHSEFNTEGKLGSDSRFIYIYINNPSQPEIKLEMKGVVVH